MSFCVRDGMMAPDVGCAERMAAMSSGRGERKRSSSRRRLFQTELRRISPQSYLQASVRDSERHIRDKQLPAACAVSDRC